MSASAALPPMPVMPESMPSPSVLAPYIDAVHSLVHPVSGPILNTANRFHGWKENMGLVQPGTVENLTKEVSQVHLANWFFEGARADVAKVVSANPAFQLTHSFSLGGQGSGKYNFGAIFANASTFLQGGVDGSGQVTMRANQTWSPSNITKLQGQLTSEPGRSMIQVEHDYLAPHFSFNWKSMNPGLLDGTGIHIASLIHSVTPRVSVGVETIFQRQQPSVTEIMSSYLLKITSLPSVVSAAAAINPAGVPSAPTFNPSWIATAQLQPTGNIQATYYQKLSDKVDVALDLTTNFSPAMPMMGQPGKREATTTFGAKYDFRMATFRGQVDSQGKVGMLLEQRFTPAFAFLVGGEIDHAKGASRFGVGIMIESSSMTQEEMIAAGMLQPA